MAQADISQARTICASDNQTARKNGLGSAEGIRQGGTSGTEVGAFVSEKGAPSRLSDLAPWLAWRLLR
jgi:hypothetical protein